MKDDEVTERKLNDYFNTLKANYFASSPLPKNTKYVFFCYFSGHGAIQNMTEICLSNPLNSKYRLENELDALKNACTQMFVLSTLDCCRKEYI